MSALLIWMNTEEAKLFHVDAQRINVEKIVYDGGPHPSESLGRNHTKNQTDEESFYRQLLQKIKSAPESHIILMGPSLGAVHFNRFLEKHHDDLHSKVICVEKVDRMPDSEILSVGRKFLQRYYLYNPA